jgi:hypothetical protein
MTENFSLLGFDKVREKLRMVKDEIRAEKLELCRKEGVWEGTLKDGSCVSSP